MLVKLAWRNLWRQKRRTVLTASALALALFLSLLMRGFQEGSYANNIDNAARFYTGLIQLQNSDYVESQSIDDLLPASAAFIQPAKQHANISQILPRIESFALSASGDKSKGVMVLGVLPEQEDAYSGIASKLSQGEFLTQADDQVLIGEGLARYYNITVGDEIVLYGQGYQGHTAAGLYRIKGILHFPVSQLDNQLVYMPLAQAQALYSTGEQVTSWVLHTKELAGLPQTEQDLQQAYDVMASQASGGRPLDVVVRDWQDLSPEMAQQILLDRAGGLFLMYILYGVVGFGLFATLMMMTLERQREFGVMLATGMLRSRLLQLISIESLLIGLLGIALGVLTALPILLWFSAFPIELTGETGKMMLEMGYEPIIPVLINSALFLDQIQIVLILLVLCLLYPMWRTYRLCLVDALKGGAHGH
ncbi:ABC transporter permease [Photobacterium swingsii]|uniref:ABC transporter permease n=1 Tax=Photobacterium swingsii TaxID=680026 RepID=UPI004069436A